MPYTNNVPLPSQQMKVTTTPIQVNFASIQTLLDVNHVDFSDVTNMGKHNYVSLPQQINPDGTIKLPSTSSGEIAAYAALSTYTGNIELFLRPSSNGVPIQLTNYSSSQSYGTGFCRLPSGLLIKWGTINVNLTGLQSFLFPLTTPSGQAIPAFSSACYYVGLSLTNNVNFSVIMNLYQAPTTTGFNINFNNRLGYPYPVPYFAIGN